MTIDKKDIKTGFAWTNCKVGCNKQTKHIFLNKYPDTENNNIGSIMQPLNYEDACLCE